MKRKLLLAIDFDGTVVEHKWPNIGKPMPDAFEVLKELRDAGYDLILWTCRTPIGDVDDNGTLQQAIDFCKINGIEFVSHNENLDEHLVSYNLVGTDNVAKKIIADYYIDDKIIGGFPGWNVIRQVLLENKKLEFCVLDECYQ